MRDYWTWDGSVIKGEDGRYHMFASRWPKRFPMHPGWLFLSEIVRATSNTIEGPYEFEEVVLPARDKSFFDGRMTHNPSIRKVGDTYLLYYIGVTYGVDLPESPEDIPLETTSSTDPWCREIWLNKRIGLATSKSLEGPWIRSNQPVLEPRPEKWDRGTTSNPSPFVMPDGSVYMAYKSSYVTEGTKLAPFNVGIVRADNWQSPFERLTDGPALNLPDNACYVEDPFLWFQDGYFHLIMKDIRGQISGEDGCGIYAYSKDAIDWTIGSPPQAYDRDLLWDDGQNEHVGQFERPQLLFNETGNATHMLAATAYSAGDLQDVTDSWVTIVPIKS